MKLADDLARLQPPVARLAPNTPRAQDRYDRGFAVSAGFALAGTLLAPVLIATSDSRHQSHAARTVAVAPRMD